MRRLVSTLGLGSTLFAGLLLSAGCPSREVAEVKPNQNKTETKFIPVGSNRKVDILFVIDNSNSMGQEQDSLNANFPAFMSVLNTIEGGLPSVHIGVVSSNTGVGGNNIGGCGGEGDDGALQNTPRVAGCTAPGPERFIKDELGADGMTRVRNYSGTLEDSFTCIAAIGVGGCGFEQHLESMKRSLDGTQPVNAGFLRPDAYLAIVFVADEDDCSASNPQVFDTTDQSLTGPLGPLTSYRCTEFGLECDQGPPGRVAANYTNCKPRSDSPYLRHPDEYVNFLKTVKADPSLVIASAIIGNPEPVSTKLDNTGKPELNPSCSSANGSAAPGIRLLSFINAFPNNSFTSICNPDLSGALIDIAELLKAVIGNPCLSGDVNTTDIAPNKPGLQLECAVEDVKSPNTANESRDSIRRCDMDNDTTPTAGQTLPCWYAKQDAQCTAAPNLAIEVVRASGAEPPPGTFLSIACLSN